MATVNLGSIKFNWQGAYDNATAYAVDDVVSSGGNSYVCIAATTGNTPPNATYWELMAQAGTNGTDGTDLTTTLTTQGDIVYRDASGLARLGAGSAGQLLQSGGTGANVSWTDAPSGVVKKMESYEFLTRHSVSNNATGTFVDVTTGTFDKQSASSKILVIITASVWSETNGAGNTRFEIGTSGDIGQHFYTPAANTLRGVPFQYYISNNTETGTLNWKWQYDKFGSSVINPNSSDDSRILSGHGTVITIWEYE